VVGLFGGGVGRNRFWDESVRMAVGEKKSPPSNQYNYHKL